MTRKKFIKLVMSHEIQRNEAELYVQAVRFYGTYDRLYREMERGLDLRAIKKKIIRLAQMEKKTPFQVVLELTGVEQTSDIEEELR